ncbi:MAG: hypothetical protein WC888_04555 [Candidatus Izemoplasmatales bacterium]|jgi:hypothetical protein
MNPKFDEMIHKIPGVRVKAVGDVYQVYLLGYSEDVFYTSKVNCMYNQIRKSWDTFDPSKADEYIKGGVWEHDWLRHWMMHLLLCHLGRESEAIDRLRVHAKQRCVEICDGLFEITPMTNE